MATIAKKTPRNLRAVAPETPEQTAARTAELLVELRCERDAIDARIDEAQAKLETWVRETGAANVGPLAVQIRNSPPKLVGLTGKALSLATERLLAELNPIYVKEKRDLNVAQIHAAWKSDPAVAALVERTGLRVEQKESIVFVASKDAPPSA